MDSAAKILITGGTGLVGTALADALAAHGHSAVVAAGSRDGDLSRFEDAAALFDRVRPRFVFHLAAAVYGIMGNLRNKGESFLRNVLINTHVVECCRRVGVEKLVAMGSGCVYPYPAPAYPMREDMVWQGPPHPSEDSYAHAKRAMLAQLLAYKESYGTRFAFVISANLYGPHDRFDVENGHVTPALVRKFHEARGSGEDVVVWGDGTSQRDFMYATDTAEALIAVMRSIEGPVNFGSGRVHAIRELVEVLAELTGLEGRVRWDPTRPNGQAYRSYDLSKLSGTGFQPHVGLAEGLRRTYEWYAAHVAEARR